LIPLFITVRRLVIAGWYLIGQHASERFDERGIMEWQIVDGIEYGFASSSGQDTCPTPFVVKK
jgi:hypothetical protein